jgi:NADPH:quinone reductase-like Zn-dependent oxidoreductase
MMKAISISGLGGLEKLVASEVPIPQPGSNDVLVSVKAVSINPVEAKIRAGKWAGGNLPVRFFVFNDPLPLNISILGFRRVRFSVCILH